MRRVVPLFFVLLASSSMLLACSGSPDPLTHYLLRSDSGEYAGRVDAPRRVSLGRVRVAPYLNQDGIVVQTAPGQIHAADSHRWAEPLQDGLRSLLRAQLSAALGEAVNSEVSGLRNSGPTVDVYIDRLHGTMTGSASIDATYRIRAGASMSGGGSGSAADPTGDWVEYRFSQSTVLPRGGYPGLVDAQTELIGQLARAIADSLRESR